MPDSEMQFTIAADIEPLKRNLSEVDQLFRQLDRAIGQHAQSISRTLSQLVSGYFLPDSSRSTRRAFEKLAEPLLNQVLGSVLGTQGVAGQKQGPGVQIAMNIATPDANSFRMSQGQILAELASAVTRATRRYL